ncbi:MAG TPA: STAS domain-containing protein [Casimicrobiaceae bacterium]|nr:STAS domain-containing protein [Casimicrobiaceae bacterium]
MQGARGGMAPQSGTFTDSAAGWRYAGTLTFDDAAKVLEHSRALALPDTGVIDMSGLEHADSTALAVVMALKRRAAAEGRKLAIEGMPQSLHSLAVAYGVEDLLA